MPHQGPVWLHLIIIIIITGVLAVSARYLLGVSIPSSARLNLLTLDTKSPKGACADRASAIDALARTESPLPITRHRSLNKSACYH